MRRAGRLSTHGTYDLTEELRRAALPQPADGAPPAGGEPTWYRVENKDAERADVYILDEIGGWGMYADEFITALSEVTAGEIDLHVNSPGGSVWEALTIMAAVAAHPARVTAHIEGVAASAASFLVQAADEILIGTHAQMMIHDASTYAAGNAAELREVADLLDRTSADIAGVYAEASGIPAGTWRERMRATTWYSGQEAVDAGLADGVESSTRKRATAPAEDALRDQPHEGLGEDLEEWLAIAADTISGAVDEARAEIDRIVEDDEEWAPVSPEDVRASVQAVVRHMPAPPKIAPVPPDPDEPGDEWIVDRATVYNAMRGARYA